MGTLREITLAHYDRMIDWARKQDQRSSSSWGDFDRSGESPRGTDCPLCSRYKHETCEGCPVSVRMGDSECQCDNTPYAHLAVGLSSRLEWAAIVSLLEEERDFLAGLSYTD